MTTVFIVIGVALLVTLFVAFRYDHRHKRLDDSATGGVIGRRGRATRLDSKEKDARWGAGTVIHA